MKCIFFGCTDFSKELLTTLLENDIEISAIFSIPEYFNISYNKQKVRNYRFVDLSMLAKKKNIPFFWVNSEPGFKITDYKKVIREIMPDVILVLGWYYMVPKSIRDLAKYGAWGIHASLLPQYAGGAPLVWAIIKGEKETGVTLFRLDNGVDDGDIIEQESFEIKEQETIKEVVEKSIHFSKLLLIRNLKNPDNIVFKPQDKEKIKIFPQRSPNDGEIDLSWDSKRIYNFIRAQTYPYPGAFIKTIDGKKIIIEKARLE